MGKEGLNPVWEGVCLDGDYERGRRIPTDGAGLHDGRILPGVLVPEGAVPPPKGGGRDEEVEAF